MVRIRLAEKKAVIVKNEDAPWIELESVGKGKVFAPHPRSLTKVLVGTKSEICRSERLDFLVSIYNPGGYVESHAHEKTGTEHVFYVLSGRGTIILDGEKHPIEKGTTVWVPSNVKHSLINNENEPMFIAVVSVPPESLE